MVNNMDGMPMQTPLEVTLTRAPVRHIEFDAKVRIMGPLATHPNLQSVYVFNMYRAGSSVTEAVAEALAFGGNHVPWNIVRDLDGSGVGLIDHQDYSRSSVFINSSHLSLDAITQEGGYLFYGFREIPREFADRFIFTGASVLVARDLRDIGISQYAAVRKHVVAGASGGDIERLRLETAKVNLDAFLLSANTLNFLRRIARCYEPLLRRGCKLLRYEEFVTGQDFDLRGFTQAISDALSPYLSTERKMQDILANLKLRVENSPELKGHATGGKVRLYQDLPDDTLQALNAALEPELRLLGYI